jgi:hypothetical protein
MGLFGKRRDPPPPVVLSNHATAALDAMQGNQSSARTGLEALVREHSDDEQVIACAENYAPWTSIPSLWVVTDQRLHEVRKDQLHSIPLLDITQVTHGRADIDHVIVVHVDSPDVDRWPSYADGRLYFASHEIADAKRLQRGFSTALEHVRPGSTVRPSDLPEAD